MKLYSRYIFNKTAIGFAAFITILISLIWFSRAISFVKYVTENGIELSKFFYLFILILPWLLLFIIPVSLFAAILVIYNRFLTNNEISILKNAGLTKFQICKPAIFLAFLASLFCFAISLYFMPYANKELRLSRIDFHDNYANLAFNPQTFETLKNLTIYAKSRDEKNQLFGILLHDERSQQYSITITAKTGTIATENNSALLHMEDGTVQKFNYLSRKSEILNFDNYVFNLSENQKSTTTFHWKPKERYLHELTNPQETDLEDYEIRKFHTEIHQRLTYPLLPLVFAFIALSCILRGDFKRSGNFPNIIFAVFLAAIFLGLTLASADLIDGSEKFTPLLYINFALFFAIGVKMMRDNYRKK